MLRAHPAVLDAGVVGVPDARWGEMVTALVELAPDTMLDAALDEGSRDARPCARSPGTRCRSDSSPSRSCRARSPASPTTARAARRWRPDREHRRSGSDRSLRWRSGPADRYGDAEAVVDGDTRLTFRELAALAHRATAARSRGHRARRPGRDLGAELVGVDRRRARRPRRGRRGSSRSTPGSRATRRRTCSTGPTPPCSFTVRGFLDTDYVGHAARRRPRRSPCLDHVVLAARAPSDERARPSTSTSRAATRSTRQATPTHASTPSAPDDVADVIFTSGTTGRPEGRDARARRVPASPSTGGPGASGCARATGTSIVNPFFHCFGYKAGMDGVPPAGRDRAADGGARRRPRCSSW